MIGDERERARAAIDQRASDARTADRHEHDALVVAVAGVAAQRRALGERRRIEVVRVADEAEALARPLPHVRQVLAERAIEHVLGIADHQRQIADVGVMREVIDVLRVLLPRAPRLARVVLVHRHEADEVGEEHVRRGFELGVLVQVVVEVPALVADPQIVVAAFGDVGEHHEVGRHHGVHRPQRVERVQRVVLRVRLEVRALVHEQPRRRMQPLAAALDDARRRIARQEIDDEIRAPPPQRLRERDVALHVAQADRARQQQHLLRPGARATLLGHAARDRRREPLRFDGFAARERADQLVDLEHVAAGQPVAAALERHQLRVRDALGDLDADLVRHDAIGVAVEDERRRADVGEQRAHVFLAELASSDSARISPVVPLAHSTPSSMPLSECGSGCIDVKKRCA